MNNCKYCNNEKILLSEDVPCVVFDKIVEEDDTLIVIVDRGYLRIVYNNDYGCLDHGKRIKINYCPMCGSKV